MKLGKIENDTIVQIGVFDPDNIPTWANAWIDATNLKVGMIDDGNGIFIDPPIDPLTSNELDSIRDSAYDHIDSIAEIARLRHITDGAGQSMTYQLKANEADAYKAAGYPADLTSYPFIQGESTSTGQTSTEVANLVIAQRDAWIFIGANIEAERMGGKAAVFIATDKDGIDVAVRNAIEALNAI